MRHHLEELRRCIRTRQSIRMIPVAPPERTCASRLCLEPKVRRVKNFRAKATSLIRNPLPPTNKHRHEHPCIKEQDRDARRAQVARPGSRWARADSKRSRLLRRRFFRRLCRRPSSLVILGLGSVMPDDATDRCAGHGMMSGHVTDDTAHRSALQASFRTAHAGYPGDRCGNCNTQQ